MMLMTVVCGDSNDVDDGGSGGGGDGDSNDVDDGGDVMMWRNG